MPGLLEQRSMPAQQPSSAHSPVPQIDVPAALLPAAVGSESPGVTKPVLAPLPPPFLSRFHAIRRFSDKARRKVKQLIGKADNSPWIIRPSGGGTRCTYVDFLFGLDYLSPNAPLVQLFKEAMGRLGLSFLLVNKNNLEAVTRDIQRGWLRPHVYLDLASALDKGFWNLLEVADQQGIYTVGKVSTLPIWTIKASSQLLLEKAGLPLPPTVIFKRDDIDRDLTAHERSLLGEKVVVKPSFGVSGRGAVVGVPPTAAAIGKARDFNRQDDWLVQKMISWTRCGDRPAYLRAYNIFGHRSLLWWVREGGREWYDLLTWDDLEKFDLLPVVKLIDRVTDITGMDFFSSEVAITSAAAPDRFVLIDYVNDQCDLDTEDGPDKKGIPEAWARWVCEKCAEFVYRIKYNIPAPSGHGLHLF